jgi:hypothetical protein
MKQYKVGQSLTAIQDTPILKLFSVAQKGDVIRKGEEVKIIGAEHGSFALSGALHRCTVSMLERYFA